MPDPVAATHAEVPFCACRFLRGCVVMGARSVRVAEEAIAVYVLGQR
jgi:hypothetical protein